MTAAVRGSGWIFPHHWQRQRDLLRELVARDIKLRYRGSFVGILWTLLNPLAELLVLLFVFGVVFQVGIPNFPSYLFTGLIVFGWFQTSLNFATGAIVGNRELVRRPGVPAAILPVVIVASNLVHFLFSLPILAAMLVTGGVTFGPAVLMLPVLIALQFALILALAFPVAIVHVWFRDTQHLLRIALQLLFYLTPVFYDTRSVPANLAWIHQANPLAHLVEAYRAVLMRNELPAGSSLAYLTVGSLVLLVVGFAWFRRASHRFADEL